MTWKIAAVAILCALLAPAAVAHRIDEYLQATLLTLGKDRVQASMRLIPGIQVSAAVIAAIDANHDGVFSTDEEHAYAQRILADLSITLDGKTLQPTLTAVSLPQPAQLRDGLGEIHVEYVVNLPPGGLGRTLTLENRHFPANSVYLVNVVAPDDGTTLILAQKRNQRQSLYELDFQQGSPAPQTPWSRLRTWGRGLQLASLFHLGMRHIAEGTDHLLFLLVLLLPAPLLSAHARWSATVSVRATVLHILGIVTAFTVGHSITLTLAALGFVRIPSGPVEVLIAVSILVSAVHALRPLFPGREAFIAAFFGLIHGLAFAATLNRLGLGRWDRVAGILAFNLGIESMQLLVVAAILPSLLLISRTRAYPAVRITGASFAGIASIGWIVERSLHIGTPVDAVVNTIARHAPMLAILFLAASLALFAAPGTTIETQS